MKNIITILLVLILPICAYFIINKDTKYFDAIAKENTPTLYIYTSAMCLDCQKLKNVIAELTPIYDEKVNFLQINAMERNKRVQDLIKKHEIVLVPTIIILDRNGNKLNKIEGYTEKDKLINEIEEAING